MYPPGVPRFGMNSISEEYMNRCLAMDVSSQSEIATVLGGVDSLLYVMEYMEHGNFNVMLHQSPCLGIMRSIHLKIQEPQSPDPSAKLPG